jgi:hypothetical protein
MGLISAIITTAFAKSRIEKIIRYISEHIFNPHYVDKDHFFFEIREMGLKREIRNNTWVFFYDAIDSDYLGEVKRNGMTWGFNPQVCVQSIYIAFHFYEKNINDIEIIMVYFRNPEQYKYMSEYIKQKFSDFEKRYNRSLIQGNSVYPKIIFAENGLTAYYSKVPKIVLRDPCKNEKNKELILDTDKLMGILGQQYTTDFSNYIKYYSNIKQYYNINVEEENERTNKLIIYITNNNMWNENFPEFKYNYNNDIEYKIARKKHDMECALVRQKRLNFLAFVYKEYFGKILSNPKRFIVLDDDEYLIEIYYECQHYVPGRINDPRIKAKLTEEEYKLYFA